MDLIFLAVMREGVNWNDIRMIPDIISRKGSKFGAVCPEFMPEFHKQFAEVVFSFPGLYVYAPKLVTPGIAFL